LPTLQFYLKKLTSASLATRSACVWQTVTLLKGHPTRYHHHHYYVTYPHNKIASSPLCAALKSVAQPIAMDVDQALNGMSFPSGGGFSDAQYMVVACMLLHSPHHAVDWKELAGVVGAVDGAGNAILTFYRHFLQVKAHSGIIGNEGADHLAHKAAVNQKFDILAKHSKQSWLPCRRATSFD